MSARIGFDAFALQGALGRRRHTANRLAGGERRPPRDSALSPGDARDVESGPYGAASYLEQPTLPLVCGLLRYRLVAASLQQ